MTRQRTQNKVRFPVRIEAHSSPQCPLRLWSLPGLAINRYKAHSTEAKLLGHDAGKLFHLVSGLQNSWCYTSIPPQFWRRVNYVNGRNLSSNLIWDTKDLSDINNQASILYKINILLPNMIYIFLYIYMIYI